MPSQSRVTIALVSLACLYSVVLLQKQTELYNLVKFRVNFPNLLGKAGPSPAFDRPLPHLQHLCSGTDWIPNLWLHCHSGCGPDKKSFCGGLNNARNRVQTCLRWAIDAGAGLILPPVTMRGEDLVNTNGEQQCLDAWWDLKTLQDAMAVSCPQLQLRAACEGLNHTGAMLPLGNLAGTAAVLRPPNRGYPDPRYAIGTFRENMALPALQGAAALATASAVSVTAAGATVISVPTNTDDESNNITIFEYGDSFLGWDYRVSNELDTIRKELHFTLPFRADLLKIGDTIARSLQLQGGAFIGVHLRGESDWPSGWGNADQQMSIYETEMLQIQETVPDGADVSVVYVSSGNQQAIETFRARLEPLNFTVHDKWTIFQDRAADLALVEELDFDSRGIIDFEVLVQARFYMGIFMSTMSKYVAYTRTADDVEDFYDTYIFPGVSHVGGDVLFPEPFTIRGNHYTSLIVTNGYYLWDSFP